jgi:nucleotide-binding universal stress UspA family protein
MYEQIVVALDGSPAAERVLEHAEALATAFGSHITLLHATLSAEMVLAQASAGDTGAGQVAPALDPDPVLEADHQTAANYVNGVAARLRQRGLTVEVETPEGPADNLIVERAHALGAQLILMTTHGRGGLGRVVFGSTADAVMRHAPCPVLMVRIHDEDAASAS